MIGITSYWLWVSFAMLCSIGLLIYAYATGEANVSRRVSVGSNGASRTSKSVSRLLRMCRLNECTWRLPGIRINPRYRALATVEVACVADYSARFRLSRKEIIR